MIAKHTVSAAKKQTEVFVDIAGAAKIKRAVTPVMVSVLALPKKLTSEGEVGPKVTL